jgi:hypothetical protein
LGCVLFEALTGIPPFTGSSALETMMMHGSTPMPTLKEASVGIDFGPELEEILCRMLAKDPEDRYQNCEELALDLARLQDPSERAALATELSALQSARAKKAAAKSAPLPNERFLTAALVAVALLSGVLTHWYDHSQSIKLASKALPLMEPAAPQSLGRVDMRLDVLPKADETSPQRAPFLKSKDAHNIVFDFGDRLIGQIGSGDHLQLIDNWKNANGKVTLPNHKLVVLRSDWNVLSTTATSLRRFQDGDLYGINFYGVDGTAILAEKNYGTTYDDALIYANHLRSLRSLEMNSTPVTIDGLNNIKLDGLTKLEVLDVKQTQIHGTDLAPHKKILNQLKQLSIGGLDNVRSVIKAMKGSAKLEELGIDSGQLTDEDMPTVVSFTNLTFLGMTDNPGITDKGVALLTHLPKLGMLFLDGCSVSPACLQSLERVPHLYYVSLKSKSSKSKSWKEDDKLYFKARLSRRGVKVDLDAKEERYKDNEQ